MNINRRQWVKGISASAAAFALSPYTFADSANNTLPVRKANVLSEPKLINAGIGGNNTIEMLARIDKDCLVYRPELTILMAGTNDMNSVKHVPLAQYEENMNQMAQQIIGNGSKLLIMTILPLYEPYLLTRHPAAFYLPEGVPTRREQVNEAIKRVAQKNNVHLLDIGQRFAAIGKVGLDKDSLIQNEANANKTDGIHPTPNGYRFIALSVYDYITDHNLPTDNIVCFGDSITKGDGTTTKNSYPGFLYQLLTTTISEKK